MIRRAVAVSGLVLAVLAPLAGCGTTVPVGGPGGGVASNGLGTPGGGSAGGDGQPTGVATGRAAPGAVTPGAAGLSGGGAGGGGVGSGPAVGPPVAPGGVAPAAPRRGPVELGILYSKNAAAQQALGVSLPTNFDSLAAAKVLINYYNTHGGMAGRHVTYVSDVFGADDPSYQVDLQAACQKFTVDNHVTAVLDLAGAWVPAFQQCLTAAHTPYVGPTVSDTQEMNAFPGMVNPSDRSLNDRMSAVIDLLSQTGYLSHSSRIGVVYETCPNTSRVLTDTVLPDAQRHGLSVVKTFGMTCITGFGSAGQGAEELQQAVLQFATAHVNRVAFISNYESAVILLFAQDADNAHYYPGYALTTNAGAGTYAGSGGIPADQMVNFHGVGWQPLADTNDFKPVSPAGSRCLAILRAGDLVPASAGDFQTAYTACEMFFYQDTLMSLEGGGAGWTAAQAALRVVGASFQSVLSLAGRSDVWPGHQAGAAAAAPFAYFTSCSCVRYTEAPQTYR